MRGYRAPIGAVFADTGLEPVRVYTHLRWLIDTLKKTIDAPMQRLEALERQSVRSQ